MTMSTAQIANLYGCLAMTLEMPFKDTTATSDPIYGWSTRRCKKLAHLLPGRHEFLPGQSIFQAATGVKSDFVIKLATLLIIFFRHFFHTSFQRLIHITQLFLRSIVPHFLRYFHGTEFRPAH